MKKTVFALLALVFCLSACTPAASQPAGEAPATVETAPAEEAEEPSVAPVGNLAMNASLRAQEDGYYYTGVWGDRASGEAKWAVLRLDYATGQRQLLQTFGLYADSNAPVDPFVRNGTVYCSVDDTFYGIPLDGGEEKIIPMQEYTYWMLSDENACYTVAMNAFTEMPRPPVRRMDLQTGAMTGWELPAMNLTAVYSSRDSRLLVSRLITDQPLPPMEEAELFDAVLQNATMEYGWMDLATGDWQGILSFPYSSQRGDAAGQTEQWSYEGMSGDDLYFRRMVIDEAGNTLSTTLERCALDGSGMTEVLKLPSGRNLYPVCRGADLVWLMDYNYSGPATIYDVENGKTWENIPVQSDDSGWPAELTDDSRVLVNDHYDGGQPTYALISQEDYLSGSRDWTVFTDAEN